MQKTNTKAMTTLIIVLSVILAISLSVTLVLAYFTATRSAYTTIRFDKGINLDVSNIAKDDQGNYVWLTNKTQKNSDDTTYNPNVAGGSELVQLYPIEVTARGADAYVAIKPSIVGSEGAPDADFQMASDWAPIGNTGWFVYKYVDAQNISKMTMDIPTLAVQATTIGNTASMNAYIDATYNCTVLVVASDTIPGLEATIALRDTSNQDIDINGDAVNGVNTNTN
ncbi:MAG: hypothetical protein IKC79_03075 [Clostridia bacterium]|nr:hypothetical protein [Clostridia bacterium]